MKRKTIYITLNERDAQKVKKGYPLIEKNAIHKQELPTEEGGIMFVRDHQNKYIATGYYGNQNKGVGWVLTKDPNESIDFNFFVRIFTTAIKKREQFFQSEHTNAFRLFNGEGDGLGGLIIDYYAGYLVLNWYSKGIYTFKDEIIKALDTATKYVGMYEKKRFQQEGQYIEDNDFVKGQVAPEPLLIKENHIQYAVYLNDGAMVGIFLDQRDVRRLIRDKYSKGKTILNAFSYTGAFSVAAALGGATTVSVDLAKRSSEKTREQFVVNGLDPDEHYIRVMDVFDYFKYAKRKNIEFDLVVLDPPSFARSKKRVFSTSKDYPMLIQEASEITADGGYIVASTNNASFNMKKFKQFIDDAFKGTNTTYKLHEHFTLPEDFAIQPQYKEGNYLKVIVIEVEHNEF